MKAFQIEQEILFSKDLRKDLLALLLLTDVLYRKQRYYEAAKRWLRVNAKEGSRLTCKSKGRLYS